MGVPEAQCQPANDWDEESQISDRPVHEISDEEDERGEAQGPSAAAGTSTSKDEIDFSLLKEGKMKALLKARHDKAKEGDRLGDPINDTLATIINEFAEETKVNTEMERLSKDFPRVKNLGKIQVPKLDQELFPAIDQHARNWDISMQHIQRALVSSIAAMAPLCALMLNRAEEDEELEAYSGNMVSAIHILTLANLSLSNKRREHLRLSMQHTYAKALGRPQDGSPEWLFGGNLSESTRKCEVAKKIAEKMFKRKPTQNTTNQNQNAKPQGNMQQGKRFKGPGWQNKQNQFNPKNFGYQHVQFPVPGQWGYQQQYPQQQNQQQFRPNNQAQGKAQGQQQSKDFQQRGSRK